jgi:hypothetical protein
MLSEAMNGNDGTANWGFPSAFQDEHGYPRAASFAELADWFESKREEIVA